ncbi:RNA methyltransferase [Desulfopila sp. IMCC35008]|uniref:RNA methyltransferase n=1 Tax=Desulfopila sp. IMCC35008 TaxID=2653858 RepID=UPI0013D4480F|nr:RNA methyltransferase [Desulfopila sp. IMCC35008]
MVSRATRTKRRQAQKYAEKRYERHRRHNLVYAQPGAYQFVVVLDNLKPSFNIGKIFRSGDAFGARSVHLIGTNFFEVKSAKGSFKWVPAVFNNSFDECYRQLHPEGYSFFILEPDAKQSLNEISFPANSAFVFGHEEFGISFDADKYEGVSPIRIPQSGKVESLNVSVAASIVMYEYVRQMEILLAPHT